MPRRGDLTNGSEACDHGHLDGFGRRLGACSLSGNRGAPRLSESALLSTTIPEPGHLYEMTTRQSGVESDHGVTHPLRETMLGQTRQGAIAEQRHWPLLFHAREAG